MNTTFCFEDWEFDSASGELRQDGQPAIRIQPQPAQLLTLLLERAGHVVTREDVIQAVWPNTKVEFDQAVNYSIRHLRAALGESAAESRFIETLPRRGYRFQVPVTRRSSTSPHPETAHHRSKRALGIVLGIGFVVLAVGSFVLRQPQARLVPVGAEADGLAVMVLRHETGDSATAAAAFSISERLTAGLTRTLSSRARVIGPRTTEDYRSRDSVLFRLRTDVGADYLLSGSVTLDTAQGLFLELIRISDGAHVWAMWGAPTDSDFLAGVIDSVALRIR